VIRLLLLLLPLIAIAEERIVLEHADRMRTVQLGENQVHELEGNVLVIHGERRIRFELGRYNQASGMLYCVKDVLVEEAGRTLAADELVYDEAREQLQARGNIHAVGDSMESWAEKGNWNQGLSHGTLNIQARLLDHRQQIELTAGEIEADHEAGFYRATRGPVLRVLSEPQTVLKGNVIHWSRADSLAMALHKVTLEREDFTASCDSMVWHDSRQRVEFLEGPVLSREGRRISGNRIEALLTDERQLDSLLVEGQARMDSPADSVDVLLKDVLEGDRLEMDFVAGRLSTVFVDGHARSVIFLKDEREKPGMNVADARRMWFTLNDQKLETLSMSGSVSARWVPLIAPPGRDETEVEEAE
jgi:hypothetical protein